MRVGIYALRQQEKLLMSSSYLDEIPNNRQSVLNHILMACDLSAHN